MRQRVYQLKYRHLLLRNSVFWWVRERVCVRMAGKHTRKCVEAVVTKLIRLFELHIHWTTVEIKRVTMPELKKYKKKEK